MTMILFASSTNIHSDTDKSSPVPGDIASEDEQDEFRAAVRHACGMEGRVWQARRCGSSAAALGRVTGGGRGTELLILLSLCQR